MSVRLVISLFFLVFALSSVWANVSTLNVVRYEGQGPVKKPSPRPSPPPDTPDPNNPGGPGKILVGRIFGDIDVDRLTPEERMKKIIEANEIIARTFKAGNEALLAATQASRERNSDEAIQKFTLAIAQYDEGLAADAGQPALLTNKAVALKGRGVERYNAAISSKTLDEAGRNAALQTAKDDFKSASEASNKAVTLIKAQPVPTDPQELQRYNANKYAVLITNAQAMSLFVSKVDPNYAEAGRTSFREYIAVETDPAKKAKAQLELAQMLLDAGVADQALAEFRAILATQPDSPEANLGAGFALYESGNKAKFQEAANYLQRFVDLSPEANPMKDDAKAILEQLKNSQGVTPESTAKPAYKRP